MSGGTFDYNDNHITMIAIEQKIKDNSQGLSAETLKSFQEAVMLLRRASVLVHRIH